MIFIAMAMMYYGLILLKLRMNIMKVGDADSSGPEGNGKELTISIIKWDLSMLIIYVIIFIIFNVCYFSIY